MQAAAPPKPIVSLLSPAVLAGIAVFYINDFTDENYNIPAGEFILLALILGQLIVKKQLLHTLTLNICLWLGVALTAWCTFIHYMHSGVFAESIRVMSRIALYYLIIIGYMMMPDKRFLFRIIMGFLAGYMINFIHQSIFYLLFKGFGSFYELKYIIPTPAIIVMLLMFMRQFLSRPFFWLLLGFFLFALVMMPLIGSRGAFISTLVGLLFFAIARYTRLPRAVFIVIALYIPLIPATVMSIVYEPYSPTMPALWLMEIDYNTHSNVERITMLYSNITTIMEHPIVGIGTAAMVPTFEPYFVEMSGLAHATAESPHNYYMEFAVPFGVPATLIVLGILALIYRHAFKSVQRMGVSRGFAAFAITVIAWVMLYQPVASITRMDIFIILFSVLFGMQRMFIRESEFITPVGMQGRDRI